MIRRLKGHSDSVICLDFRNQLLISGSEDATARIWDVRTNKAVRCITKFDGAVTAVCLSADTQHGFVAAESKVHCFDLRKMSVIITSTEGECVMTANDEVNQLAINEKGSYLAAADDTGDVHVLKLGKLGAQSDSSALQCSVFKRLRGVHSNICSSVVFRPKTTWEVVSGGMDCTVCCWDFNRGRPFFKPLDASQVGVEVSEDKAQTVNPPFVHSLAASLDGKHVLAALGDGHVAVWDLKRKGKEGHLVACLDAHRASACQVSFLRSSVSASSASSVSSLFVSAGNDCEVALWDLDPIERTAIARSALRSTSTSTSAKAKSKRKNKKKKPAGDSGDAGDAGDAGDSENAGGGVAAEVGDGVGDDTDVSQKAKYRFRIPKSPNWLTATSESNDGSCVVYVCDTTPVISAYHIRPPA